MESLEVNPLGDPSSDIRPTGDLGPKTLDNPATHDLDAIEKGRPKAHDEIPSLGDEEFQARRTEPGIPTWQFATLCISLCLGLFLSFLDTSIVATAIFTIGTDLNALNSITWIALSYTLSYVGCAIIFARIADIAGRKYTYAAAFVIFLAFSLGCGFSNDLASLVACRALQGIGGAGLYSVTVIILPEISTKKMQIFIGSIIGAVVAMSGVLGPVLGGIIIRYTTWKWLFWINAPVSLLALVLLFIAWPSEEQLPILKRRPIRELDIIGGVLLTAASVLVVLSFQEAGIIANAWGKGLFIGPLAAGCVCCVLFSVWEFVVSNRGFGSITPILPGRLLSSRVYTSAALGTALTGFVYFVVIYNLPLRFQVVNGKSPLTAGVGLLPMLGSTAVASMVGGMVLGKTNRSFEILVVGSCLLVIGSGLLTTLKDTHHVEPKTYGFLVFIGFGFGLTVSTASFLAATRSEPRDHAVAQGIIAQSRVLGGSIGIAAATAILGQMEHKNLISIGLVSESQLSSLETASASFNVEQLLAVSKTFSDSFRETMIVCTIIAGLAVLASLGTWDLKPVDLQDMMRERERGAQEREE
ncbi:MFS multidrug transporter-like protein [Xylogone sp. PMI_703]|nr:MFS multidrug transporter-like protein [Xylogone sp. PMI_703]